MISQLMQIFKQIDKSVAELLLLNLFYEKAKTYRYGRLCYLVGVTGFVSRALRPAVIRGSDSRLGCHSTPLLLRITSSYKAKTTQGKLGLSLLGKGRRY